MTPVLATPGAGGTLHQNIQQMAQTTRWADSAAPRFPKEYARKIWPFHLMAKKGEAWIQKQEAVPSAEVDLEHVEFAARVPDTVSADHGDNVLGSGEGELPKNSAAKVCRDPGVNAGRVLTAVNDRVADLGVGLDHGADGAAEHREREISLVEGSEEGAITKFLLDVQVDILLGEVGRGEIGGCMTWIWRGQEGDVPPKHEAPVQLETVEIGSQVTLPVFEVEGWIGKGLL